MFFFPCWGFYHLSYIICSGGTAMSADLTQLLSPTLVYMLFCYFITLFIRKVAEG
jgi:hypothetical protein